MFSEPMIILLTLTQLVHALTALTKQYNPYVYMPVPADNVTVSGLVSDVNMIFHNEHHPIDYINPVDPRGVVEPTSTVAAPIASVPLPVKAMYNVFDQQKF